MVIDPPSPFDNNHNDSETPALKVVIYTRPSHKYNISRPIIMLKEF